MKLYYAPGVCSLSPHIVLHEAGADFDIEKVDIATRRTENGDDFAAVNPKGYVPALVLDSGDVITEGTAIIQYIADHFPTANLAPDYGTLARTRLQEQLNFIASEVHKAFYPLFNPAASEDARTAARANIARRLDYIESLMSDGRRYLLGGTFSVADAYLFTVASWTGPTGISLERWPALTAYLDRIAERPAVRAAMQAEGLIAA